MPGRTIGHQRIPAAGAPALGDTVALQHQVRHAELAQVFTHGYAGLAGADNQGIYYCFFNGHLLALRSWLTVGVDLPFPGLKTRDQPDIGKILLSWHLSINN
ncbi:hypothetical protein D3C76_1365700 [compost metagenome]